MAKAASLKELINNAGYMSWNVICFKLVGCRWYKWMAKIMKAENVRPHQMHVLLFRYRFLHLSTSIRSFSAWLFLGHFNTVLFMVVYILSNHLAKQLTTISHRHGKVTIKYVRNIPIANKCEVSHEKLHFHLRQFF